MVGFNLWGRAGGRAGGRARISGAGPGGWVWVGEWLAGSRACRGLPGSTRNRLGMTRLDSEVIRGVVVCGGGGRPACRGLPGWPGPAGRPDTRASPGRPGPPGPRGRRASRARRPLPPPPRPHTHTHAHSHSHTPHSTAQKKTSPPPPRRPRAPGPTRRLALQGSLGQRSVRVHRL